MNRKYFEKDSTQLRIFLAVVVAMIVIGFAWAYFGDADSVIPIATPTPSVQETGATPTVD
jgi:hypothetical protein